jgi:hypothetical protein
MKTDAPPPQPHEASVVMTEASLGGFARTVALLFRLPLLAALVLAGVVVGVDPYWMFGSPSVPGINESRPFYEYNVIAVKPYQTQRLRAKAVALGASTAEVGLSPDHPGWKDRNAFNAAVAAGTSYQVMLAFLQAERAAAPLKQAVVGLDFLSFSVYRKDGNIFRPENYAFDDLKAFADFLDETLAESRARAPVAPMAPAATSAPPRQASGDEGIYSVAHSDAPSERAAPQSGSNDERDPKGRRGGAGSNAREATAWDEKYYLELYPDVAAAVSGGLFRSGFDHYLRAGRGERRHFGGVPADWDEETYLIIYGDVAGAVSSGVFPSGFAHYVRAGKAERRYYARQGGAPDPDWNEAGYLAANPDVRIAIARGMYRNGFVHYMVVGRTEGRVGGLPATDLVEWLKLRWPSLHFWLFKAKEMGRLTFSPVALKDALKTIQQQAETPASFSDLGQRIWRDHQKIIDDMGGLGFFYRGWLGTQAGWWGFWFEPPEKMFCLSHPRTHVSGLDPLRFMVRRAHAEGTDLRLFVSPLHASIRRIIDAVDLGGRYEFWLRELVRINEEEAARAGHQPFPLFDFSDPNAITSEPVPESGEIKVMRWYWEIGHYRQAAGDLILDRIFDVRDPSRPLPEDFGVRLTSANIDEHLARSRDKRAAWATANPDLVALVDKALQAPRYDRQREATCW